FEQIAVLRRPGEFLVATPPDKCVRPVASREWPVVGKGSRLARLIARLERFGFHQVAVAVLCRPIARGRDTTANGPGIECVELNAPALFAGLAAVERRSLDFEFSQDKSGGDHAKTDMRRILQVVGEGSGGILTGGSAMQEGNRTERR